ncbi:DUF6349 family protein [Streptomyces sp. NBC_00124]|uniref:DUF6349 family protein n=1 Tax=Streptomyces sp. NBC_00124 TaxID=2975662 RepID=UPI00338EFCC5
MTRCSARTAHDNRTPSNTRTFRHTERDHSVITEWRTLPILDPARGGRGSKTWRIHVTATHPKAWFDAGGPLRR